MASGVGSERLSGAAEERRRGGALAEGRRHNIGKRVSDQGAGRLIWLKKKKTKKLRIEKRMEELSPSSKDPSPVQVWALGKEAEGEGDIFQSRKTRDHLCPNLGERGLGVWLMGSFGTSCTC